ncbi:MAG: dihydrodipicolinate synthase family protein, partial [Pirellulaceae bacterium]
KLGGDGGVAGGANHLPSLFERCIEAARAGDSQRIAMLQNIIDEWQAVYTIGKYASRFIKATKCSLSLLGICDDFMAEPFHRFRQPERLRVQGILETVRSQVES